MVCHLLAVQPRQAFYLSGPRTLAQGNSYSGKTQKSVHELAYVSNRYSLWFSITRNTVRAQLTQLISSDLNVKSFGKHSKIAALRLMSHPAPKSESGQRCQMDFTLRTSEWYWISWAIRPAS